MKSIKRITLLLVEDHPMVREAYRLMLGFEHDLTVVGEAQDGREAVELVKKLHPDVVVMDIAMPHLNGLEATRQVSKAVPSTKVLVLSAHGEPAYVTKAIESGALGYLTKQTSAHTLCRAVRTVQQGRTFFSPDISRLRDRFNPESSGSAEKTCQKTAELTSREVEVLQLIAEGSANKQTAAELGIGIKAVEKHREHLMDKLDIHNTAGLTRYAISIDGLIKLTMSVGGGVHVPGPRVIEPREG